MPQWVIPIEEDSISLMVSKDLFDKILGFAFCVVLDERTKIEPSNELLVHVHGGSNNDICALFFDPLHSEHICLSYNRPGDIWTALVFGQIDGKYAKLSLTKSRIAKRWGLRIICKQLGDDLKVELQDNQLINPALLYEVGHESIDSPVGSSFMHEDNSSGANRQEDLQDGQMSIEEHSHIGSKRNHEFIRTQGMPTKTLLTSNLTGRNEKGGVGLQLLLCVLGFVQLAIDQVIDVTLCKISDDLWKAKLALDSLEVPIGCVIGEKQCLIAAGRNRTNEKRNATRCAEMEALDALLEQWQRIGFLFAEVAEKYSTCSLYVT
ncbi:hypothetical protein EUGRSUZ_E02240 [Eucalyptus grandis]|uniref:Uncharacterized protein n=2 Tax=Eucalyptus grandis TaxID=71139 RepID=A0ACC3KXW8_EUCGR|nr:hypothetical protein EUGRSUZ_E02240 [Eucalyptus grandis]